MANKLMYEEHIAVGSQVGRVVLRVARWGLVSKPKYV